MTGRAADHTLLYEDGCPFCRLSLALLVVWDRGGRLRPIALEDPRAAAWVGDLPPNQRFGSWHLVTPEARLHSAGDAFPPLLAVLPGGGWLARLTGRFPRATGAVYHCVSRRRDFLARLIPGTVDGWAKGRIAARAREHPIVEATRPRQTIP